MERRNGVDNTSRRTWNKEEYVSKAKERDEKDDQEMDEKKRRRMELDPLHNGLIKRRAALTHRDKDVVLDEHLGKAHVFSLAGPLSQQPGYYCSVCECVLKDSKSYLDHINGKKHLKLLGMSMRVERVGVDRVKAKLSALKNAKTQAEEEEDWKARAKRREEEQKNKRREQREKKRKKREEEEEDGSDLDPEMMATMGFQGFGTSKK